jgi:hypothetical protein
MQEPWDYERMVRIYNRLAEERGGWHLEEQERTPQELKARYEKSPETYPDLPSFAEGLFIWDQRVNL